MAYSTLDPIRLEVFKHLFAAIAEDGKEYTLES